MVRMGRAGMYLKKLSVSNPRRLGWKCKRDLCAEPYPRLFVFNLYFFVFKFARKARKRDEQKTFFQKRKESLKMNWMQLLQDFFCWKRGWEKEQEQPQAASEQTNLLKILSKMTTRLFCFGADFLLEDDRAFNAAVLARPVQEVNWHQKSDLKTHYFRSETCV